MTKVECFVFNMFYENTFVVYNQENECIIFDPGCYDQRERKRLSDFVKGKGLSVKHLLNTHCHIDHVFGNRFCSEQFDVVLSIPEGETDMLAAFPQVAQMYGIDAIQQSPDPAILLKEGDVITLGENRFHVISAPGHSPAGICLYNEEESYLIAGDVLFEGSIGRTDLPGGNHALLLQNIEQKLLCLPDDVTVYCGHGPTTTIGKERKTNPFLQNL